MPPEGITSELVAVDPPKVTELWMLWITDNYGEPHKGGWLGAIDCAGLPYLCFENEKDAIEGAAAQLANFEIGSKPVRVI